MFTNGNEMKKKTNQNEENKINKHFKFCIQPRLIVKNKWPFNVPCSGERNVLYVTSEKNSSRTMIVEQIKQECCITLGPG